MVGGLASSTADCGQDEARLPPEGDCAGEQQQDAERGQGRDKIIMGMAVAGMGAMLAWTLLGSRWWNAWFPMPSVAPAGIEGNGRAGPG